MEGESQRQHSIYGKETAAVLSVVCRNKAVMVVRSMLVSVSVGVAVWCTQLCVRLKL